MTNNVIKDTAMKALDEVNETIMFLERGDMTEGEALDRVIFLFSNMRVACCYQMIDIVTSIDGDVMSDADCLYLIKDMLMNLVDGKPMIKFEGEFADLDDRATVDVWEYRYDPILDADGGDKSFDPTGDEVISVSEGFAKISGALPVQHIWTRVDGDDNSDILINGYRLVNRLECFICRNPWGNGVGNGKDDVDGVYIEVKYDETSDYQQYNEIGIPEHGKNHG